MRVVVLCEFSGVVRKKGPIQNISRNSGSHGRTMGRKECQ